MVFNYLKSAAVTFMSESSPKEWAQIHNIVPAFQCCNSLLHVLSLTESLEEACKLNVLYIVLCSKWNSIAHIHWIHSTVRMYIHVGWPHKPLWPPSGVSDWLPPTLSPPSWLPQAAPLFLQPDATPQGGARSHSLNQHESVLSNMVSYVNSDSLRTNKSIRESEKCKRKTDWCIKPWYKDPECVSSRFFIWNLQAFHHLNREKLFVW